MTVTAQQVFDISMSDIDNISDNGLIMSDNPDYYKTKAISFINQLQNDLMDSPTTITDLSQNLSVSDRTAFRILPYGLASLLLISENTASSMNLAAFYDNKYENLKSKIPSAIQAITDNYDVTNGMS